MQVQAQIQTNLTVKRENKEFSIKREKLRELVRIVSNLISVKTKVCKRQQQKQSLLNFEEQIIEDLSKRLDISSQADLSALSYEATVFCVALAHSRNRLHMRSFGADMPTHQTYFETLEQQAIWLRKQFDGIRYSTQAYYVNRLGLRIFGNGLIINRHLETMEQVAFSRIA